MEVIGVVGAGVMGKGVSHVFAQAGYQVILIDINDDVLVEAKQEIYNNIRFAGLFNGNQKSYNPDEIIKRIKFSYCYEILSDCDYVIENVTEKIAVKQDVYKKIDKVCKDSCIFAANTSCISITQIAAWTKRPLNVIGTHFMNPVFLISAVEIIRGYHTSDDTVEKVKRLLASIGKESILVNDYPGFVSNRISHLLMNEAAFIVQEQVASPKDVDEIFKKCYGHKMGPLETADLIGIDTVVNSLDILYESYQDSKYRCCPLLRKMVHAGKLGRKTQEGFYSYN
ncbi:MAG: 3-hydroxyacyl-CoA dehydrogenase family protein [Caulobacteraceae bacterium]